MNKNIIKQLNKRVDQILGRKNLQSFPLLGGVILNLPGVSSISHQVRPVTKTENEIAQLKGLPCPILVSISREKELQEYLNG